MKNIYKVVEKQLKIKKGKEDKEQKEIETFKEFEKPFYKRPVVWMIGLGSVLAARMVFGGKRQKVSGDMQLTKNFSLKEFLRSESIPELSEYELNENELSNLKRLAGVLQSIRDDIGAAVIINSGGRPPGLKAGAGRYKGMNFVEILRAKNYSPSEFSQHMDFSAADFTTADRRELVIIMESMLSQYYQSAMGKTITQVILYIENGVPDFIHLGVKSDINDFSRLKDRLLLALVTKGKDNEGKSFRKTKYVSFTKERMIQELTAGTPGIDDYKF